MKTFEVPVWWLERSRSTMTVDVEDEATAEQARQKAQRQMGGSEDLAELGQGKPVSETVDFGADEPQLVEEDQA